MYAIGRTVLFVAVLVCLFSAPRADAETIIVSGDTSAGENQPGWMFNRDPGTSSPYKFTLEKSSIGLGSLYVLPIGATPADKFIAELFLLMPVAELNYLSYDFLIGAGGVAADRVHFYLNVYMTFGESDPLKFYDCRYNIVPTEGSTSVFKTVKFDPQSAYSVTTRPTSPFPCPATPADMDILSPGSRIRVIAINVGDTSASDFGLDGYLDNVEINTVYGTTTYDFDPNKEMCKKGGWQDFGFRNQGQCVSHFAKNSRP